MMTIPPDIAAMMGGIFGLLIGSFLNVVIYRLPVMEDRMRREALVEALTQLGDTGPFATVESGQEKFNLLVPRSACPHCHHRITWYENIPVLSWLALRGRCSACKARISARYPAVELATGLLFAFCAWRWGVSAAGVAWCVFSALLLALAMIDWDITELPDVLTLPLLWLGLIASDMGWTGTALSASVWGAVAGYMSLWLVYHAFRLLTGKEGMGYGDFKLLAALGAWLGVQSLMTVVIVACLCGIVGWLILNFCKNLREGGYIPFGPFLAMGALVVMFVGPEYLADGIYRLMRF